jgi:RNA polymerase sigma factor (sigma-70 family)
MMRQVTTLGSAASLDEIEGVYRERAAQFERVAAAILRDREAARDAVQDAFATVVRKRGGFARRGSVDAWIWRAVVNTALNRLRTDRRQAERRSAQRTSIDDRRLDDPRDAGVLAELARLPQRQRLVVFLRYYADLDYTAIGAALGISPGTVASTLNSAHTALRRLLDEEGSHD